MFLLIGLAAVGCSSLSLMLIGRSLRKAPEGFEDEHGFHRMRKRVSAAAVVRRAKYAKPHGSKSLKRAGAHL